MPQETESPSPVPSPGALVVKNGSNIFGSASGGMPGPLSSTLTRTARPAVGSRLVAVATTRTTIVPLWSMAWIAFSSRFKSTWLICWPLPFTCGSPAATSSTIAISELRARSETSEQVLRTTAARSTGA